MYALTIVVLHLLLAVVLVLLLLHKNWTVNLSGRVILFAAVAAALSVVSAIQSFRISKNLLSLLNGMGFGTISGNSPACFWWTANSSPVPYVSASSLLASSSWKAL